MTNDVSAWLVEQWACSLLSKVSKSQICSPFIDKLEQQVFSKKNRVMKTRFFLPNNPTFYIGVLQKSAGHRKRDLMCLEHYWLGDCGDWIYWLMFGKTKSINSFCRESRTRKTCLSHHQICICQTQSKYQQILRLSEEQGECISHEFYLTVVMI